MILKYIFNILKYIYNILTLKIARAARTETSARKQSKSETHGDDKQTP